MVRILFGILLIGHGLIHSIGFFSEWNLGRPSFLRSNMLIPLNDTGARIAGVMWLIAGLLWIAIGILYFLKKQFYWKAALVALAISQLLIIIYWPYAQFGTIMNVMVLAVIMVNNARTKFEENVDHEWDLMLDRANKNIFTSTDRSTLPPVVNKWLLATKSRKVVPSRVILTQQGTMQSKPSGAWMKFNANQYYTIDPPGFIWDAQINTGPITIGGRDKFEDGKGNMRIKPLYLYTLADTSGPEMDQGTMLRFMGEIIWFPEVATMDYFQWEAIDDNSASLTMTYKGNAAKGVFTFDDNGLVKSFSAERFGTFDGKLRKEMWEVRITEHNLVDGHFIGNKCEVTWKLKEGDFTWMKLEVTDIASS